MTIYRFLRALRKLSRLGISIDHGPSSIDSHHVRGTDPTSPRKGDEVKFSQFGRNVDPGPFRNRLAARTSPGSFPAPEGRCIVATGGAARRRSRPTRNRWKSIPRFSLAPKGRRRSPPLPRSQRARHAFGVHPPRGSCASFGRIIRRSKPSPDHQGVLPKPSGSLPTTAAKRKL